MTNVEIVMIAFTVIVMLCLAPSRYYFLIVAAVLALMALSKSRSGFADGDAEGLALDQSLIYPNGFSPDLDSGSDIDAVLSRRDDITNGDDLLSNQMQVVGQQAKEAILHRTRFTSDNFRGLFQEELDAGEHRDWWEDDSLAEGTVKNEEHWEE